MAYDLFPLLHNRMDREDQVVPQFIGEFHGVDALPKGDYPAIYFWIDKKLGGGVCLSFNKPLLEGWCIEEARRAGIMVDIDDAAVQKAMATLQEISMHAFQAMESKMVK